MGTYIKLFKNDIDYQNYVKSNDYIKPNVSYAEDTEIVYYNYIPPMPDIVYYDGSSLKTIHPSKYKSDLGTAVGVIVIPKGMLPDGKARFVALQDATYSSVKWSASSTETSLTNYGKIPTTNNTGSTNTGSSHSGYLPSDDKSFAGATSYIDPETKYKGTTPYIPSPYLEDGSLNPAYCATISGNNALSDFNGKSNTDVLVGLGTAYTAANAAKNYAVDGVDIDWYLPAAGELSFIIPRLSSINEALTIAGGVNTKSSTFWSSSECSSSHAIGVNMVNGNVNTNLAKYGYYYVRSFAIID